MNIPIPPAGTIFLRYSSTPYIGHVNLVFQLSFLEERKHTPLNKHITSEWPVIRPQSGKVGLERSDFQQEDFGGLGVPHGEPRIVRPHAY